MKWSIYNEPNRDPDGGAVVYLYNTFRKKVLTLDPSLYEIMLQFRDHPMGLAEVHPDFWDCLVRERFLVEDRVDESEECRRMLTARFSSRSDVQLTLNPTLDCNLQCWYCYESLVPGSRMSPEVIDRVLEYVSRLSRDPGVERLHVSFFGGEPLLQYDNVVLPVIQASRRAFEAAGKQFGVHFTTNGVCLSSRVVEELLEILPGFGLQLAMDGGCTCHDRVKSFANGRGTYDLVLRNLVYAVDRGVDVNIRCNYTLESLPSFRDLVEDLGERASRPNVRFSFHKIWQVEENDSLRKARAEMLEFVQARGLRTNIASYLGNDLRPCYADFGNNFVINFNGDVFRCTARDFNAENRLGFLGEDGQIVAEHDASLESSFTFTVECASCRLLPICNTCSQRRRESPMNCPTPALRSHAKENIQKYFLDSRNLTF